MLGRGLWGEGTRLGPAGRGFTVCVGERAIPDQSPLGR